MARLLLIADFRRLWLVGFVSFIVRWLEMLAYGLFAYQLSNSAFVVAMVSMLRLLPMGLFGAFLGAAADRFERRTALLVSIAVSFACTLVLLVLATLGAVEVWHLAAASFINGTCWATDNPVRRVMIGDVVGRNRMGQAMSLDTATNNLSRVFGPAMSGVLLGQFGISGVFWLSAALYCVSVATAVRIRTHHHPAVHATSFLASLRESFDWLRGEPRLIGVFLITVVFNVFGWPFTSMIPVIGTDDLNLGAREVGLLASCEGIGGFVSAMLVAAFVRPSRYGRIFVGSVALYLVLIIGFVTAPNAVIAALFLLLIGASGVGFAVMQATLVYRDAPAAMRARLLGVLSVCIGTAPIGFVYLGFLAELLSPRVGTVALTTQGLLVMLLTRRYWMGVVR